MNTAINPAPERPPPHECNGHSNSHHGTLFAVLGSGNGEVARRHGLPVWAAEQPEDVARLTADDLAGVERLYCWHDPDQRGDNYVAALANRLNDLSYDGRAYEFHRRGCQDFAGLERENPSGFRELLGHALAEVVPLGKAPVRSTRPPTPQEGRRIILNYFRSRYKPVFRRGTAIRCADGSDVAMSEACALPDFSLIDQLATAKDAPQFKGGVVNRDALPKFFRDWAKVAWGQLLKETLDEDGAESGAARAAAGEEFCRLVRYALLSEVVLGEVITDRVVAAETQTRVERRSLIDWCQRFAKPGRWKSIRSKKCWCKIVLHAGGEIELKVAIRHELFAQLKADRRLTELTSNKFSRRAERYGIGKPGGQDDRPGGERAFVLDRQFVSDLLSSVPDDEESSVPDDEES